MFTLILTGGAGSGKSTACRILAEKLSSCRVIDADEVCHRLYGDENSSLTKAVAAKWGKGVLDASGRIDRKHLAEIVFNDDEAMAKLNKIAHPAIHEAIKTETAGACDKKFVVIEAALAFESGWSDEADAVISVWTDVATQRKRLEGRGLSADGINRRIASQMPEAKKLEKASFAIVNTGSRKMLEEQCGRLAGRLEKIFV